MVTVLAERVEALDVVWASEEIVVAGPGLLELADEIER